MSSVLLSLELFLLKEATTEMQAYPCEKMAVGAESEHVERNHARKLGQVIRGSCKDITAFA